jgi:hypothetical protein
MPTYKVNLPIAHGLRARVSLGPSQGLISEVQFPVERLREVHDGVASKGRIETWGLETKISTVQ